MKKIFLLLFGISLINSCSSGSEEPPPPPIKYTLTTAANPTAGGTVTPASGQHNEDATVSINATPAGEYLFSSWSGATGTTATTSVVMNSNKTVTANFIKKKYTLTTTVEGEGTVSEKVIKAGAATDYNSGTVVELTATPSTGWGFKEWQGDVTGTDNPVEITIDKAKTVKAIFEALPPFYLDENGVTIKARDWVTAGTTGELNGVTYTAVDIATLKSIVANDGDVTKVVTSLVTSMVSLFRNKEVFNQNISNWDTSSVTSMGEMFQMAKAFNQDIGNWDVSKVTDMRWMFDSARLFNQDISDWDVSNVAYMEEMFGRAYSYNNGGKALDWKNFNASTQRMFWEARIFNQDISSWNKLISPIIGMFEGAQSFNQDVSTLDVSSINNMRDLFKQAKAFNQDIGDWDVSNVTSMSNTFLGCENFDQDLSSWNVSKVTNMDGLFGTTKFNQDIGNWDVSNVDMMDNMFSFAEKFNQDLTKWCVTNITTEPTPFSDFSALTESNKPIWGTCPGNSYTIAVTASSNADYTLSGKDRSGDVSGNDPNLTFKVGDEVTFSVNAANHPFYLKTAAGTGTGNQISGVTNQGATNGNVVWTPSEAGTYYYQCSAHSGMVGTITIE